MALNMKQSSYLSLLVMGAGTGILALFWKVARATTNARILLIFNVYFLSILVLVPPSLLPFPLTGTRANSVTLFFPVLHP